MTRCVTESGTISAAPCAFGVGLTPTVNRNRSQPLPISIVIDVYDLSQCKRGRVSGTAKTMPCSLGEAASLVLHKIC